MNPTWTDKYPAREVLKREVRCMVDVFVEVLLERIGEENIEGIYFKGSAQKDWTSPIDYVPEISDVDIHLLFADDAGVAKHLGTAEQAMRIQAEVEQRYFAALEDPVHTVRPQLIVLNDLMKWEDYVHPPREISETVYGADLPGGDFDDTNRLRDVARRELAELDEYLRTFPGRVVDKPGRYLWEAIRHIVWNVSPVAPKVVILLGVTPTDAWRMNRTAIVSRLTEMHQERLAEDYAGFYLAGWDYFLSRYADHDVARRALLSGIRTIRRGIEIAGQ